jgi:hypothetical protein
MKDVFDYYQRLELVADEYVCALLAVRKRGVVKVARKLANQHGSYESGLFVDIYDGYAIIDNYPRKVTRH